MQWKVVLNSPIPRGFYGRNLTSSECKVLRRLGVSCSESWIVVRYADSSTLGILYYPAKQGSGFDHAGVYVTTK